MDVFNMDVNSMDLINEPCMHYVRLKKWEHQWDNVKPSNELGSKISQTLTNYYNIMCAMHCDLDNHQFITFVWY